MPSPESPETPETTAPPATLDAPGTSAASERPPSPEDRRSYRRVELGIEAMLVVVDGNHAGGDAEGNAGGGAEAASATWVTIENLGPDGAFLKTTRSLGAGARVRVRFRLLSYPLAFDAPADVRWRRTDPEPGLGVQFTGLPAYEQAAIGDHLHAWLDERRGDTGEQF